MARVASSNTDAQIRYVFEQWHATNFARDPVGISALYDEDAKFESPSVLILKQGVDGILHGREAIRGFFELFFSRVSEERRAGAAVRERVTQETTMLVVREQNVKVVGAAGKSSKMREAEKLVSQGFPVLVVSEADFRELIRGPGGYD